MLIGFKFSSNGSSQLRNNFKELNGLADAAYDLVLSIS
jgi:hypothetical protein